MPIDSTQSNNRNLKEEILRVKKYEQTTQSVIVEQAYNTTFSNIGPTISLSIEEKGERKYRQRGQTQ